MEHLGKKVKNGVIWTFLERISTKAVQFILQLILARLLVPEDYGLCAILLAFINIATILINSGLPTALIQKEGVKSIDFSSVFYISFTLSCFFYLILFFSAPRIALFFNDSRLDSLIKVISITLIIGSYNSVQMTVMSKQLAFRKLFYANIIAIIISASISIIMAYNNYGVWSIVYQYIINRIAVTILLSIQIKWYPKLEFSFQRIKVLFSFGWKCMTSSLLSNVITDIYTATIGKFFTKAELGTYDTGTKIPSTISETFSSSLGSVLFPAFSTIQSDRPKLKSYVKKANIISSFLLFPIMFTAAALAKPIICILLSDKWINAIPFFQLACILYAFYPLHIANIQAINAIGRSDISLKNEITKKAIDILFLFIMIHISLIYVAIGRVATSLIALWINTIPSKKFLNYPTMEQIKDIYKSLLISLILAYFISYIDAQYITEPGILPLTICILSSVLLYVITSFIFNKKTLLDVLRILKQKN